MRARFAYGVSVIAVAVLLGWTAWHLDLVGIALDGRGFPLPVALAWIGLVTWAGVCGVLVYGTHRFESRGDPASRSTAVLLKHALLLIALLAVGTSLYADFDARHVLVFAAAAPALLALGLACQTPRVAAKLSGVESVLAASSITKAAVALESPLVAILILELTVRLLVGSPQVTTQDDYGTRADFVLAPYLMFAEPSVEQGGSLNTQGFPGPELGRKGARDLRVAILGGSTVWSGGTTVSIAAYLQRSLAPHFPGRDVRVVNYGRSSYISRQELILLQLQVLPRAFDLVIVYDGFNDFWMPRYFEPQGQPYLFSQLRRRIELSEQVFIFGNLVDRLARKSMPFRLLNARATGQRPAQPGFSLESVAHEYEQNLFQMASLGEAYGTRVLLATQPHVGSKRNRTPAEEQFVNAETTEGLPVLERAAVAVAERTRAEHVGLQGVFGERSDELYYDTVHVHPELAHPIVAEALADRILRNGLLE